MTKAELRDFVDQGQLDSSLVEGFDALYEPSWCGADWDDDTAKSELEAYNDARRSW